MTHPTSRTQGKNVVVLGAGVVGLTTALELSRLTTHKITVAARHMPGDYDIEYTSPWAGANYLPISTKGSAAADWDRGTWPELQRLAKEVPEAGVHFQDALIYTREKDVAKYSKTPDSLPEILSVAPWYKDIIPNFRELPKNELPPGICSGTAFTSVVMNTPVYLSWLAGQCLKNGVVLRRAAIKHILDAAHLHHSGKKADLVVNCTGLLASRLGGVEDKSVVPVRGQTVLVRNEAGKMYKVSGTDDADDEVLYIMQRAAGGGTLLGGCYRTGDWDSQPDPNLALRIMKRCVDVCPDLTGGKGVEALDVVRHGVGLRPLRLGGVRLEKERIDGLWVVHNYGHGGFGYQSSYGCAQAAVRLVEEALSPVAKL